MAKTNKPESTKAVDKVEEEKTVVSQPVNDSGKPSGEAIAETLVGGNPHGVDVKELAHEKEVSQELKRQEDERISKLPRKEQDQQREVKKLIESESEALDLVQREYRAPEGIKGAVVTADGCVFWPSNSSSAHNHAVRNNLKLFNVTWD